MPFVTLTQERNRAAETFAKGQATGVVGGASSRFLNLRRPEIGLEDRKDSPATLSVVSDDLLNIPLVSSSGRGSGQAYSYADFFVQSVSHPRRERYQIVHTFGEPYVTFFGEDVEIIQVSGLLLNSANFNWKSEFIHNYQNFLRGTKLVEKRARAYLTFDDVVVGGYILDLNVQQDSQFRNAIPMSFSMFVTYYAPISGLGTSGTEDQESINLNYKYFVSSAEEEALRTGAPNTIQQIQDMHGTISMMEGDKEFPMGGWDKAKDIYGKTKAMAKQVVPYMQSAKAMINYVNGQVRDYGPLGLVTSVINNKYMAGLAPCKVIQQVWGEAAEIAPIGAGVALVSSEISTGCVTFVQGTLGEDRTDLSRGWRSLTGSLANVGEYSLGGKYSVVTPIHSVI